MIISQINLSGLGSLSCQHLRNIGFKCLFFKGKAKVWWLYTYFLKLQNWNKRKTRCMVMLCPLAFFGSVVDALLRILYQFLSRSKRCRDNFEIYYMCVISKSSKQKFILSLYFFLTMTISRLSSSQNGVLLHVVMWLVPWPL